MKIIINEKSIKRNKQIGRGMTIISLVVLGIGLYISFTPEYFSYSLAALVIGFMLSQLGIYYTTRWGRSPRPDEQITAALKGLDDKYSLYHFTTVVPHLLLGPAGLWILAPFTQRGTITYQNGQWKQKGVNLYLRIFAQEGLGRPDLEIRSMTGDLEKFLAKELGPEAPEFKVAAIFTHPKVDIQCPESEIPTMVADKLKDFVRRMAREDPLPQETVEKLEAIFPKEAK